MFGYTGMIDVSARGEGRRTWKAGSWLGKSFDTFAPIGPCIATADEIADPNDVHVQFWVDGQLRHNYNTDDMEHRVPELVEFATRIMTLNSGDLIAAAPTTRAWARCRTARSSTSRSTGSAACGSTCAIRSKRTWEKGIYMGQDSVNHEAVRRNRPQDAHLLRSEPLPTSWSQHVTNPLYDWRLATPADITTTGRDLRRPERALASRTATLAGQICAAACSGSRPDGSTAGVETECWRGPFAPELFVPGTIRRNLRRASRCPMDLAFDNQGNSSDRYLSRHEEDRAPGSRRRLPGCPRPALTATAWDRPVSCCRELRRGSAVVHRHHGASIRGRRWPRSGSLERLRRRHRRGWRARIVAYRLLFGISTRSGRILPKSAVCGRNGWRSHQPLARAGRRLTRRDRAIDGPTTLAVAETG